MRIFAAAVMLGLVAAGHGSAAAQSSPLPPGVSPEEAHAGCVHTQLRGCMISLGAAFWFDMNAVTAQIARRNELDVNGRTAHRKLVIDAKVPHKPGMIGIILTLASPAPNDEVVGSEITLPRDPDLAHTASEYDATLLYDVVSVVLGNRCPNLDKLALYRFYENGIKPREQPKTEVKNQGPYETTKMTVDTGEVPFCGALFRLRREDERPGPPDAARRLINRAFDRMRSVLDID